MKISSARAGSVSWNGGVRELERPAGRKTMEVEILKEALDVAG